MSLYVAWLTELFSLLPCVSVVTFCEQQMRIHQSLDNTTVLSGSNNLLNKIPRAVSGSNFFNSYLSWLS